MGNEFLVKMGERIARRRKELKMTQEELAEKLEVSIPMISNLEQGKKAIRPENLANLCAVLDLSADYILTGKPVGKNDYPKFFIATEEFSDEDLHIIESLIEYIKSKR